MSALLTVLTPWSSPASGSAAQRPLISQSSDAGRDVGLPGALVHEIAALAPIALPAPLLCPAKTRRIR